MSIFIILMAQMNEGLDEEVWPSDGSDIEEFVRSRRYTAPLPIQQGFLYLLLCGNSIIMCQILLFFACYGS